MSTLSKKSFGPPEDADAQKKSSEIRTNEKEDEVQKDEKRNLRYKLAEQIYPLDLRNWPIFNLLKREFMPEFFPQIHMVMVYGDWGNKAIVVTKDKNVYSLDLHHNKDDHSKTGETHIALYPNKIEKLCGKNIKTFAHSSYFILALTQEGEVYSWEFKKRGSDEGSYIPVAPTPTRVAGLSEKRIVDIACGSCHSLALTSDGKVYAWGENNHGQVGNESTAIFDGSLPRQVKYELNRKNVVRIACGSTFNMVVTDGDKLYGWGNNESGQISIDNTTFQPILSPTTSTIFDTTFQPKISRATSTSNLSGSPFGQPPKSTKSGFSFNTTSSNVQSQKHYVYPREITAISDKIVDVACGSEHTLALTDKGQIYAWGKNNNGQVGGINKLKSSGPVMVDVSKIKEIAAYGSLSVAVGINETIYVWGDCFGQDITAPLSTEFSRIHDAFAHSKLNSVMHKPLIVSDTKDYEYVKEVLNILESIGTAFDDPLTSDSIIEVEGQRIHVHKAILKIRCQYLKNNMFQHENDESTSDSSELYTEDKYSYVIYKAFLKYLYTGRVDLPSENALELMKLADAYCEASLKRDCGEMIEQAITVSNVAFFYNKAIECNAKKLEEFCFQFALRNMKAVIKSDEYKKLDMNTMVNFMDRAADEDAFRT